MHKSNKNLLGNVYSVVGVYTHTLHPKFECYCQVILPIVVALWVICWEKINTDKQTTVGVEDFV